MLGRVIRKCQLIQMIVPLFACRDEVFPLTQLSVFWPLQDRRGAWKNQKDRLFPFQDIFWFWPQLVRVKFATICDREASYGTRTELAQSRVAFSFNNWKKRHFYASHVNIHISRDTLQPDLHQINLISDLYTVDLI